MTKLNLKILFIIKILVVGLFCSFASYSSDLSKSKGMVILGSNDALVKIKIFSSLTCPHCANFHTEVVSQIKKEYVETGKVQLIFVDFPLDQAAFNASKLLHCIDNSHQMRFLDTIYEKQNEWTNSTNMNDVNNSLKKIVENLGISSINFEE